MLMRPQDVKDETVHGYILSQDQDEILDGQTDQDKTKTRRKLCLTTVSKPRLRLYLRSFSTASKVLSNCVNMKIFSSK